MIPFYFFRRKAVSPVASLYHSELMDNVDYWGKMDRLAILEEIRHYSKMYALDLGLTCGLFVCLLEALLLLARVLMGVPYQPDYFSIIIDLVLVMFCTLAGSLHILGQYEEALEFSGGGHV